MRRLKIGIRPQLIVLVCFSSLFSLLILAVVTGVYFSTNLSDLRAERLEVISQLKTSQIRQAVEYLFYQVYWLATKDTITSPLTSYRAGNNSLGLFTDAQFALDQFLTSSETFALCRLYNLDIDVVAQSSKPQTLSDPAAAYLYPLMKNTLVPLALFDSSAAGTQNTYFTGPVANSSVDGVYYIGITLPVFANSSIILTTPVISGYLTVVANAATIQSAINDTSSGGPSASKDSDYSVVTVKPVYQSAIDDHSLGSGSIIGFETVFPSLNGVLEPNRIYNINLSAAIRESLLKDFGSSTNVKSYTGHHLAIGYTQIQIDLGTYWAVIIEQPRLQFLAPVKRLKNIIIGVVIGIGVFMCLLTFPLAVFFIRPITKLKEATEAITKSKRKKDALNEKHAAHPPAYGTISPTATDQNTSKRLSVYSANTSGSTSLYSTGIRLPSRIPNSKKIFKDELTELSDAFNIMTEELDKQYTHLDDRVKLRTKELEALKLEAEAANEAKTVFIANISHELRTPLNGILGMTSIAMDEPDQSRIQDSLKLIHRSGELLLHILTELLTYSKNSLNRSKLEKSHFQILEIVDQVQSIFGKLAIDQRVNLNISLRPNVIRKLILYGDSNRIIQIVMNLVSNSLKFTPIDGSVDVSFKLLGEYDHQRSKEGNYEKVYVIKKASEVCESPETCRNDPEPAKIVRTGASDRHSLISNKDSTDSSQNSNKGLSFGSENDNISLMTLSTSEYENTIFQSQFQNSKPLPATPVLSRTTTNISGTQPKDTSSIIESQEIASQASGPHEVPEPIAKDDSSPTSSNPKDDSDKTIPVRPVAVPRDSTTSYSGLLRAANSHVSGNEGASHIGPGLLTGEHSKKNKVFNMRNLYRPKSWAIQIEVTDTGAGIEPALQEKVFEPFIQGDQTLSRSYGGTGLGLSICKQLAKMMRGSLTLKSTIGKGSTFTFTVPLPQTGEILVGEDELEEFCEDEFNPRSKVNRRVAFDVTDDSSTTRESAVPAVDSSPDEHLSEEEMQERKLSSDSSRPCSDMPLVRIDGPEGQKGARPAFKREFLHKLDLPPRNSLKDQPHMMTRSSTGTANSSGTDRLERNLLADLKHLRILVAEDNSVNQEVIKRMLQLEGFLNVTMACNGAEAVEYVQESYDNFEHFDLIFMDVQMPKIDGLTATRMIRNNLRYENPIIALTAFADESNVKECLNSGMTGFLAKPIKRANLRKIITQFSPHLLSEIVTTPQTHHSDERRLGYGSSYIDTSNNHTNNHSNNSNSGFLFEPGHKHNGSTLSVGNKSAKNASTVSVNDSPKDTARGRPE